MKFSVYSCMAADYPAEKLVGKLKELGYDGVEWTVGYPKALWDTSSEWHIGETNIEEDAKRIREITRKEGLEIPSLGSCCACWEPKRIEGIFKAAKFLGAPQARVAMYGYDGEADYFTLYKKAVNDLKVAQEISRDTGVKGILEIHMGTIISSPSLALRVLENFDPEYIGVIFDPGNMVWEGYERWKMGIEMLGGYVSHVHIKNYGCYYKEGEKKWVYEPTSLEDGIADYKEIISSLGTMNYQGYLSMEDFRGGYCIEPVGITTEEKMREDIEYLRNIK